MPQPEAPPTNSPYVDGAKIIEQRPDGQGNVLVTFALPDFRTGTVRVPYSTWVEGWSHLLGPVLARIVTRYP